MPEAFDRFWETAVSIVWGLPLVFLVIASSLYFLFLSRLRPFLLIQHAFSLLLGKHEHKNAPGQISHFQALCSALSGTIGMGNIAGVAIAITAGGAGAVFWMWLAGLLGMITKFFTCTLSCLYRKKDQHGQLHGGPMYFIEMGLGKRYKPLAVMFAFCGMIGCMPMFQSNQLASLLADQWSIANWLSGLLFAILVGMSVIGGIQRIGAITSKLVPFMFLFYLILTSGIILINIERLPDIILDIFSSAFGTEAVVGGAAGLTFKEVLITGIKRAVFSNEAGVGTEALVHGAAKTSEPVREGLVAMLGPIFDTLIVCSLTAFVILLSEVDGSKSGALLAAMAFESELPSFGGLALLLIFSLFAVSTMITYAYYSQKCAVYLFGENISKGYIYVYLLSIMLAALWQQLTIINIIDTMFALMVFPTLLSTLLLSPQVMRELQKYLRKM